MRMVFLVLGFLISPAVFAVCPLCTFAVGAGIGLSQYLGIDDTISGLWIGGMLVSLIIMTEHWLTKKNITFRGMVIILSFIYYGSVIVPLHLRGIVGHELNKCWGFDKILIGITIGSVFFLAGDLVYRWLKKHNDNRAYFPFQKVVMPLVPLVILSVFFYFLTK